MTSASNLNRRALLCAASFLASGLPAWGADYPVRPVTLVVPYPAGGTVDALARLVAEQLEKAWSQRVLVDNRPGANSLIGTQYVARAPADGYTLLINLPAILLNAILMPKPGYDPLTSFAAVTDLATSSAILSVRATLPVRTIAELTQQGRTPHGVTVASWGAGSTAHIHALVLASAGVPVRSIPYKGEAAAVQDMMGGVLDAAFLSALTVRGLAKEGKVRPLAVSGPRRLAALPDVPTLGELGVAGTYPATTLGLFAPAGTPRAVVDKIQRQVAADLAQPAMAARLAENFGFNPGGSDPDAFAVRTKNEYGVWQGVIRQHGVTLE